MPLTEDDLFTSGDFAPVGNTAYRCIFFNQMWMLEAIMQAITLMCDPSNWNTVGSLSPEDCASLAVQMVEVFDPMVNTVGMCMPYASDVLPDGALWCDGSSYLRTDYAELFDVIGTVFGTDDETHFSVPDLRDRTVIAKGEGYDLLGQMVGESEHTLTPLEMPIHDHEIVASLPEFALEPGELPVFGINILSPIGNTEPAGGDQPHNNVQPSFVLNYIILAR